jgi:hypothetical protein
MSERDLAAVPATPDDARQLVFRRRAPGAVAAASSLVAGLAALVLFAAVGREFYGDFELPQGSGMYSLLPEELAFCSLFLVFGLAAWAALTIAVCATRLPDAMARLAAAAGRRPRTLAIVVAALVALLCAVLGSSVLGRAVISDDEHVYQLIARTLRGGALTSPSPGGDLAFFREQFVVLTAQARYGKYPIGHPILLALGQSLGLEHLVVPVVTGAIAILVVLLTRSLTGAAASALAGALFALSPQVLFTGATYLSQPAAALCLCGAVAAAIRASPTRSPGWCALAGALLGYGILVRPRPGVLFVPVAVVFIAVEGRDLAAGALRATAALLAPVAFAVGAMLLVNRAQAGHALVTAYGQSLAPGQGAEGILLTTVATPAVRAMSLVGSLIRWNFWLFGWPLSFLFLAGARFTGPRRLLWGMVGAELFYRLLTPKVGVGGAGPIYFFEATPLLCVLSADGAARLAQGRWGLRLSARATATIVLAGTIVSLCAFLPSRLMDLRRMGAAQNAPADMLRARGIHEAVVFHQAIVPWWTRSSWAYYPACNGPALDDDIVYLFLPAELPPAASVEVWRRRYPRRSAWFFGYRDGRPFLEPLAEHLAQAFPAPPAAP